MSNAICFQHTNDFGRKDRFFHWYSTVLRPTNFGYFAEKIGEFSVDERFRLSGYGAKSYMLGNTKESINVELVFENGKLIENNIIPIEDYKIGNKLSLLISLSEYKGFTYVQGVITENNGKMVRLEILPLVVGEKTIEFEYKPWVNPRYCKRIE